MNATAPELQVFVRSLAPNGGADRQRTVLDRLEKLTERDRIADYEVAVWGDAVARDSPLAETDAARSILDRIAAFRAWAEANERSIEPFYATTTVESQFTNDRVTETSLPALAVAEYRDGELVAVTPHVDDDTVVAVQDHLDRLAGEQVERDGHATAPAQPALD